MINTNSNWTCLPCRVKERDNTHTSQQVQICQTCGECHVRRAAGGHQTHRANEEVAQERKVSDRRREDKRPRRYIQEEMSQTCLLSAAHSLFFQTTFFSHHQGDPYRAEAPAGGLNRAPIHPHVCLPPSLCLSAAFQGHFTRVTKHFQNCVFCPVIWM